MPTGSEWAGLLPEKLSMAREQQILDAVKEGPTVVNWKPIVLEHGLFRATAMVTADPVQLGVRGDSLRVSTTGYTAQKIADVLSAVLPTPKLLDEKHRQSDLQLKPCVCGTQKMTSMTRMVQHHNCVQKQIDQYMQELYGGEVDAEDLIISPEGKHWVVSNRYYQKPLTNGKPTAVNYGWYSKTKATGPAATLPDWNVWQTIGTFHDYSHQDYSQTIELVGRKMQVCVPKAMAVAGLGTAVIPPGDTGPCQLMGLGQGPNGGCLLSDGTEGKLLQRAQAVGMGK